LNFMIFSRAGSVLSSSVIDSTLFGNEQFVDSQGVTHTGYR